VEKITEKVLLKELRLYQEWARKTKTEKEESYDPYVRLKSVYYRGQEEAIEAVLSMLTTDFRVSTYLK
jgi:uncharacterized protein with von Willebrand factor type A (vWA) domain